MVSGLIPAVVGPDVVGNDLVGWNLGYNRGKSSDRRFIDRVFSTHEQQLIRASDCPDFTLWWLWAAKEACYKASVKLGSLVFSPSRFEVSSQRETVTDPRGQVWFVGSNEANNCLHVWVAPTLAQLVQVRTRVDLAGPDESEGVRRLALELLGAHGLEGCRIQGRPPEVWQGLRRLPGDLSLSHDEGYAAVAWLGD